MMTEITTENTHYTNTIKIMAEVIYSSNTEEHIIIFILKCFKHQLSQMHSNADLWPLKAHLKLKETHVRVFFSQETDLRCT